MKKQTPKKQTKKQTKKQSIHKQSQCSHEYKFFPEKLNALPIRKIRGICVKCQENIELTPKEYNEYLESKQ